MAQNQEVEAHRLAVTTALNKAQQERVEQPIQIHNVVYYVDAEGVLRLVAEHGQDLERSLETMRQIRDILRTLRSGRQ